MKNTIAKSLKRNINIFRVSGILINNVEDGLRIDATGAIEFINEVDQNVKGFVSLNFRLTKFRTLLTLNN